MPGNGDYGAFTDDDESGDCAVWLNTFFADCGASNDINAATWFFFYIEYTYSSNTISIEINESDAPTTRSSGSAGANDSDFCTAEDNGTANDGVCQGSSSVQGRYDEYGVANRKLTDTEQGCPYNAGSGRSYSDAIANCF